MIFSRGLQKFGWPTLNRCVWTSVAQNLERIGQAYEGRRLSRQALIVGLQHAFDPQLRLFSRRLTLPFAADRPMPGCMGASAQLAQRLQSQAISSLLGSTRVQVPFAQWLQMFRKLHAAHQRVQQLSAQSRAQVRFLSVFVPVMGGCLCLANMSRLIANLEHGLGVLLFTCVLVFYGLGVLLAHRMVTSVLQPGAGIRLERTSGQFEFLSEILSLSGGDLNRSEVLSVGLRRCADPQLRAVSKQQSLPFSAPLDFPLERSNPSASEFLSSLRSGFVHAPIRPLDWVLQTHAVIFDRLCAEAAHGAAKLSVQLLIPMAIFFLPALFLILALCGFSLGGDTLDSN